MLSSNPASPGGTPNPVRARKEKKRSAFGALQRVHFAYKEREYFSENLALLLKSAVPVGQALHSLQDSSTSKPLKKALSTMEADIEAGMNLADALERSGLVSTQTLALVRLGENSGHLIENLQLAAQQEEKRHVFASKVRSALIYPTFVLSLTVLVALGVAWFLLPRLAQTFSQLDVKLPAISRVLIGGGTFLKEHGAVAVPLAFLVVAVVAYILFAAPKTKHIGRRMLFMLPGIGRLMREVEIAQFGYLLGTLLNAGLPVTQAVKLLAGASSSPDHQKFYNYLADSLDDGFSFKDSLDKYKNSGKLIPKPVQQMVIAGERSGSLPEVLLTVGRTYEQKADTTTDNLEAIIEPILLVIVWLGVMIVAVAVVIPIYSLVGGLNK
ncbi:MAG TPA: type II secretion system F family protein [Candidatus Saccharimonadales bacterium]|nr:type II secretion system F family protein [Candidatus Saccharimonadales bacterium]